MALPPPRAPSLSPARARPCPSPLAGGAARLAPPLRAAALALPPPTRPTTATLPPCPRRRAAPPLLARRRPGPAPCSPGAAPARARSPGAAARFARPCPGAARPRPRRVRAAFGPCARHPGPVAARVALLAPSAFPRAVIFLVVVNSQTPLVNVLRRALCRATNLSNFRFY
jgi:hypothetical protein